MRASLGIPRLLALTCVLLAPGCAVNPRAAGPAAASLAHTTLAPPDAPGARNATQIIRAAFGPRAFTLATAIQIDAAGLKVVGLTATGQRLFTVSFDGTAVTADKSLVVPDEMDPKRLLADVQLALWPLAAIESAFHANGLTVTEPFSGVRRLSRGDTLVAEVHYASADPWSGRLWLVNFEHGYSLTIDTSTPN
jgi:hypothetical protein